MSEDGTSLILRLLQDIRATQGKHDQLLAELSCKISMLNRKFDGWQETKATGLGPAFLANISNTAIEAELEAARRHDAALEGSLGTAGH